MPEKILGLDISSDSITAVQVISGLKGFEITTCGRMMIDEESGLKGALQGLLHQMDLKSDTYRTSIPGEDVSYRNLQMPFKESKKIRQTLPFEIETVVPFSIEDLIVDFSVVDRSDQSEILVASVRKNFISEYLEQLQSSGIDPEVLDIRCVPIISLLLNEQDTPDNGLILEIGPKKNTMVLYVKRRMALIRTFSLDGGLSTPSDVEDPDLVSSETPTTEQIESQIISLCEMIQRTIHSFGWQSNRAIHPEKIFFTGKGALYSETGNILTRYLDAPAEQINLSGYKKVRMNKEVARVWDSATMDNALALALRQDRQSQGFNLRRQEFEVEKHYLGLKKELKKVAVFMVFILSFLMADLSVDYYYLQKRYNVLDQKIMAVFKQTFPDVKRIFDPIKQMKSKINELKSPTVSSPGLAQNNKVLDLLRDVSQRLPKSMDLLVTRMEVDPDTMRITGNTDTFNTVDNIKSGLEPSSYFRNVTISSANLDRSGKRVQFEIKLQRQR